MKTDDNKETVDHKSNTEILPVSHNTPLLEDSPWLQPSEPHDSWSPKMLYQMLCSQPKPS
ncbi:hypothetical protein Bca4012_077325 [Brassica carinata]|uniref:Uncharacterized protein n=1 Tax=Brassica carinata TaxID=52824 RepID=A0A8X7Q9J2_BRACI|nr:hypothetical protein Bca52824_072396 [Brassica carinata]